MLFIASPPRNGLGTRQHTCEIISDYMPLFSKLQPLGLKGVYENIGRRSSSEGERRLAKWANDASKDAFVDKTYPIPIALAEAAFSI